MEKLWPVCRKFWWNFRINLEEILGRYVMRSEKSYTMSENLFLWKINSKKLLRWKISLLSSEWKCAEGVPNNISVQVSVIFVEFRLSYSQIFPKSPWKSCTFLTNQGKSVVSFSEIDFRMTISIKNRFRTIIFSLIKRTQGRNFFFFKCSSNNLRLDFLKMSFFRF